MVNDPRAVPTVAEAALADYPYARCGRFEVTGVLGAGGMGIVLAAYDPDLDRRVAVKLLYAPPGTPGASGTPDPAQTTRLSQEARAMARLAHPNVVTVYEVGAVGDRIFLAMEQVEGTTLRGWLAARPRTWREIVAMFVAAGRGLVAAHAQGVVHRDFKPDNVLIGADGRPRVTDFGLATSAGELAPPGGDPNASHAGLGTPAYMPPEQWARRATDPRGDQFAFCVSLWEGVYGERPFAGEAADELREAISAGVPRDPPRGRAPRWLEAALRRGLATDPAARWPELGALLDRLERLARRRRGWSIAATLGGLAAAAGLALAIRPGAAAPPCRTVAQPLAAMWSPVEQLRVARGFLASDAPIAGATWAKLASAIARWGEQWSAMRIDACEATEVRREQSAALLDLRMACLDDRRRELASLLETFAHALPEIVTEAVKGFAQLEPIGRCADTAGLIGVAQPPPERALQVAAIRRELADISAASELKLAAGNTARARRAVALAREVGYRPVEAEAMYALERAQKVDGDYALALQTVEAAALLADQVGDDRLRTRAWSEAIAVAGSDLRRADETARAAGQARAALARVRAPGPIAAQLHHNLASAAWGLGNFDEGLREIDIALSLTDPVTERLRYAQMVNTRGLLLFELRRFGDAIATYRRALPLYRAEYGEDHPAVAGLLSNLANATNLGTTDHAEAERLSREAIAIAGRSLGPDHPLVATYLNNLANVLIKTDQFAEALPLARRAAEIRERKLRPDHPYTIRAIINLATCLANTDHRAEAEQMFARGMAMQERSLPPGHLDRAYTDGLRGENQLAMGDAPGALASFEHARALYIRAEGEASSQATWVTGWQARALIASGALARGLVVAEQTLARFRAAGSKADAGDLGFARWVHGEALYALGRRAEARADARAAIALLAADPDAERDVLRAKIERWLAAR